MGAFGSGSLLAGRGIDEVWALDVIVEAASWSRFVGRTVHLSDHDVDVVGIDDRISLGTR